MFNKSANSVGVRDEYLTPGIRVFSILGAKKYCAASYKFSTQSFSEEEEYDW